MDECCKITRHPILLSPHDVVVLHIFHKHDHLEDMWMSDIEQYMIEKYEGYEGAAKQLISQMEGHWCPAFMIALRDESDRLVKEWEEQRDRP